MQHRVFAPWCHPPAVASIKRAVFHLSALAGLAPALSLPPAYATHLIAAVPSLPRVPRFGGLETARSGGAPRRPVPAGALEPDEAPQVAQQHRLVLQDLMSLPGAARSLGPVAALAGNIPCTPSRFRLVRPGIAGAGWFLLR